MIAWFRLSMGQGNTHCPEDTMKVVYAWLMTGGQDGDKATMRSTSLMDLEFSGGWRSVNGNPTQFYTEGSDNDEVIGFYRT